MVWVVVHIRSESNPDPALCEPILQGVVTQLPLGNNRCDYFMETQQEVIGTYGFFINHIRAMGPRQLAAANLPFDRSITNGISMRVMPLSSMLNSSPEEVFLQTINGQLMLIYTVNLPATRNKRGYNPGSTLQFFLLPQAYQPSLNLMSTYQDIKPMLDKISGEKGKRIHDLIHDKITRSKNAQKLIMLIEDNLLVPSDYIPRLDYDMFTRENFPLAIFNLTQLGPTVNYLDEYTDQSLNWKNICVLSMIQSNIGQTYEENINILPVGDHLLLSISIMFRDKQATDKRLRNLSLLQFAIQIRSDLVGYLPNLETIKQVQERIKEEIDIPILLANKGKRYREGIHEHILLILREIMSKHH